MPKIVPAKQHTPEEALTGHCLVCNSPIGIPCKYLDWKKVLDLQSGEMVWKLTVRDKVVPHSRRLKDVGYVDRLKEKHG